MPKKFNSLKDNPFEGLLLYPNELFILVSPYTVKGIYDYYCISTYGRVWHRYLNKLIKPGISGSGYLYFMASTEYGSEPIQIHRLVMMTFKPIKDPDLYEVNHKDGNKLNPHIDNLYWCSHRMNVIHAYNTGLQNVGENNVHSKITNEQATLICKLLQENKYTNKEIACIIEGECTENIVSSIKQGLSWNTISDNFYFESRVGKLFDEKMVRDLCTYFSNISIGILTIKDHCRNALRFYGYNDNERFVDTARKIYTRKYYTNISCEYKF